MLDGYLTKEIYLGGQFEHNKVQGEITKNGEVVPIDFSKLVSVNIQLAQWTNFYELDDIFTMYLDFDDTVTNATFYSTDLPMLKEKIDSILANPTEQWFKDNGLLRYGNSTFEKQLKDLREFKAILDHEISLEDDNTYNYRRSY